MTFALPWALAGLALIPLLVLLERWRRRPRDRTWPSLLLWRGLGGAETRRRRRVEPLLAYECIATALLVLAAAGPGWSAGSARRVVEFVIDTGPHMQARLADGRTAEEATRAELERIRAALSPGDEVLERPASADPGTEAARPFPGGVRYLATYRPVARTASTVPVGRAPAGHNLGIDAVMVDGDRLWLAVATDGPARRVRVRLDEREESVETGRGFETRFAGVVEILDPDNYDGDDRVELSRAPLRVRDETGSRYVAAALAAGYPTAAQGEPQLVLTARGGTPFEGEVSGAACLVHDPLFEGLLLDDCRWRGVRVRPGGGLLEYRGHALAAWLDPATFWTGLPLDREWDQSGTLPLLIERIKRARAIAVAGKRGVLAGDAIALPAPGLVDTRGVDRPWDGTLPSPALRPAPPAGLRAALALAAAAVLALYVRAIVQRS